jgi:hypothetical protein
MKVIYGQFGGLELEIEDGRDMLWMKEFIENIPGNYKPLLSNFIRVDLETSCRMNDGTPAEDIDLEETIQNNREYMWGYPTRLRIDPFGYYATGVEKRVNKFLGKPTTGKKTNVRPDQECSSQSPHIIAAGKNICPHGAYENECPVIDCANHKLNHE